MAKWSIEPQTIYIRGDAKIEFRARQMNVGHNYTMDVTIGGVTRRVHFSPSGDALRVETLTFQENGGTIELA